MTNLKIVLRSILLTVGLFFSYNQNNAFLSSFKSSLMSNGILLNMFSIILMFIFFSYKDFFKKMHCNWIQWCISIFLGVNQLFRVAIAGTGGLTILYSSVSNILICFVILYTYIYLFNLFQYLFYVVVVKVTEGYKGDKRNRTGVNYFAMKYPFLFSFIIILIIWIPILIINYPSTLVVDSFRQLKEYYGIMQITNAHPPIHTALLGLSVDLGMKLGSANIGLFISNLPQIILTLVGFSLTSLNIKVMDLPISFLWGNIIIGGFSPAILSSLTISTKDLLFSSCILVVYNIVVLYITNKSKKTYTKLNYALLFIITTTLVILFRKNGIYMMIPVIIVIIISIVIKLFKRCTKKDITSSFMLLVILLLPIFLSKGIDSYLESKYDMESDVRKSEMLSIPFQQTARYVKKFPEDVTQQEKKVIGKVLDYDNIGKLYNPTLSDAVKSTTPKDVSNNDLINYFGVWLKMFFKHPVTYVESTAAQNYSLFSPENLNFYYNTLEWGYAKQINNDKARKENDILKEKIGLKSTDYKIDTQNKLVSFYVFLDSLPIIGLLSNFSFFIIVLLMIFSMSTKIKRYDILILTLPMLMLLLTIFAGPVVRGYIRYSLPFIMVLPILFSYVFYSYKKGVSTDQDLIID